MTRNQIWITVGAIAAALAIGIGVTLVLTGGGSDSAIDTTGTTTSAPTTTTAAKPATTPATTPATAAPTTAPTVPPSTLPAPTVSIVPQTTTPTTVKPTVPPTASPASTTPSSTAPSPTTLPTPTTTTPAAEPGITATEIRVAVIADSQDTIAGVNAWAATVNAKKTGLAGRKVVVDVFSVGGDATRYADAVRTACTQDFAIVGSSSVADSAVDGLAGCKIPDLPARAVTAAHRSNATTYAVVPTSATKELVGGFKWLLTEVDGCCKQFVVRSTDPVAAAATDQSAQAAVTVGFTQGGSAALAPDAGQSAYAPVVTQMKSAQATFGRSDLPFDSTIKLRTEATTQSLTGVEAWFCLAQCYTPTFLSQGGPAVEDEYVQIATNPFEEAGSIPAMARYLAKDGPRNQVGLEAYAAGLLFESAVKGVVLDVGKGGVTRAAVLGKVAGVQDFTAGGILGPTDVGARAPSGCFVMLRVADNKFTRATPTGATKLSCGDQNLLSVGP